MKPELQTTHTQLENPAEARGRSLRSHILQCALREKIILPPAIDRIAASHFVEAVFAAAHRLFREPGINAAETAQPSRPPARERNPQVDAAQGSWF